ncbi:MAG: cell division protein ZapB [Treponema sp.]|nr:cell division protein ZapB [Treponema sp.]
MISLDQVLQLEEKVESAVKKIEQLNVENAALRRKCAELTNALATKSEQFSSFQTDQSKIEEGILKALSRLNAVENVVLSAVNGTAQASSAPVSQVAEPVSENVSPETVVQSVSQTASSIEPVKENVVPGSFQPENQNNTENQISEAASESAEVEIQQENVIPHEIELQKPEFATSLPPSGESGSVPVIQEQPVINQMPNPDAVSSQSPNTSDVEFEFGDTDSTVPQNEGQPSAPMFDIF